MKNFSLKFLDIMIGIVLGLGFQWWPELTQPWQYIAFVFVYLDIIDYWIDYGPSLKKFPPKREMDIFLDVAIMFSLFFYIYSTQLDILYFLISFIGLKVLDYFWLLSSKHEYHPTRTDGVFVDAWLKFNIIESAITLGIVLLALYTALSSLYLLIAFIVIRIFIRVLASFKYKKVHFA